MNEMLIGLLLFQGILLGFISGWYVSNKNVKEIRKDLENVRIMYGELHREKLQLEEKCKTLVEATPKVSAVNPLDNVLSALIAETDKQDEAEALRLKEIKSAWNYQPVGLSKRMKGDS